MLDSKIRLKSVLSLFDGISCLRIALERLGIDFENYYASEIEPNCIKISKNNYDDVIHVGDIYGITESNEYQGIESHELDLLVGGSPCQGFSLLGNQLNFDDPRSKLFFEYVRLLRELEPKWFIFENVKMSQKVVEVISKILGVEPIEINSSLFSPQNRRRLYWTNIPNVKERLPLKNDIEGKSVFENQDYSPATVRKAKKGQSHRQIVSPNGSKLPCLTYSYYKGVNADGRPGKALLHNFGDYAVGKIEMLSPLECERLQTVPDGYTKGVSKTNRYKALGNGFTVKVIEHILECIPNED